MAEVLVIGNGGREDAIRQTLLASDEVENVVATLDVPAGLKSFSKSREKPFVIIGPEAPLVMGLADELRDDGYVVFGATEEAAQYEASKSLSVLMMRKAGIPHPDTFIATRGEQVSEYTDLHDPESYVIKADGLAGGKGVVLPATRVEARKICRDMLRGSIYGDAGKEGINFQARYHGPEVSAMVVVGTNDEFTILPLSQDHKRLGEGDIGPNTGGMGAYAPVPSSIVTKEHYQQIHDISELSLKGMRKEGVPYERAVLYIGFILSEELDGNPAVIEYNVRFGDPETQVILPLVQKAGIDVYRLLRSAAEGDLKAPKVDFSNIGLSALTVCLASNGYPDTPRKGDQIWGLEYEHDGVTLQRAAVSNDDKTSGGRVLYVTGVGDTIDHAAQLAYDAIDLNSDGLKSGKVGFEGMQVRKDIGYQARVK